MAARPVYPAHKVRRSRPPVNPLVSDSLQFNHARLAFFAFGHDLAGKPASTLADHG